MISDMRTVALLLFVVSTTLAQGFQPAPASPGQWPERDAYLAMEATPPGFPIHGPKPMLKSGKAMIAGVTNPFAVHAGMEMLKAGGSAADASLTTVLAQVALNAGAAVSYAGILTAVYYDAGSMKVYSLNAGWNTPKDEIDPRSIPSMGTASGRTALVPGFMAGVQALHDRFGRRPLAELFEPTIWLAENGFPLTPVIDTWRRSQKSSIERLSETRKVFQNDAGEYYSEGDTFRQRQLAGVLKSVASDGAKYMYEGEWAHHFVDDIQHEGGKITLQDMASYQVIWTEPARATYHGYEVTSMGLPNLGGLQTLSALKLAEAANVRGDYRSSADSLYSLIQIAHIEAVVAFTPAERLDTLFPGIDPAPESRLSNATTKRLLKVLRNKNWFSNVAAGKPTPKHSSGVVVVDEQGNVAAILHSCNCLLWGSTGIFVGGISIPDAASFQQDAIARAGRGVRLPETTNPLIVSKKSSTRARVFHHRVRAPGSDVAESGQCARFGHGSADRRESAEFPGSLSGNKLGRTSTTPTK